MPNAVRAKSKKESSPLARLIVTVVLLIVVAGLVYWVVQRAAQTSEFNAIIKETVEQQKYKEAVPRLEAFIAKAQGDLRDHAKTELAKCHLAIGDDPGLSMKQSAEIFKKAHDLDPSTLDEQQRKILELGSKGTVAQE